MALLRSPSHDRLDLLLATPPLPRAYSHRDCELEPPLVRSLEQGFRHIEVDVFCLLGTLFVAHDPNRLRPWRTLRRLYLEPLRALARRRAMHGPTGELRLWLYLDVKTRAEPALGAVKRLLEEYPDLIGSATPGGDGPVRVVLTGNRPAPEALGASPHRLVSLDGRSHDLDTSTDPSVMPIVSDDWSALFTWRGAGAIPAAEAELLEQMVEKAHANGQALRFWGTPDAPGPERERVWSYLLDVGVDLISTDDVAGLRAFLDSRPG